MTSCIVTASLVQRLNADGGASAPQTLAAASPFFSKESSRILPDLSTSILLAFISGTDSERACLHLSEYFHERSGVATAPEVGHSRLGRLLVVTLIESSYIFVLSQSFWRCTLTPDQLFIRRAGPECQPFRAWMLRSRSTTSPDQTSHSMPWILQLRCAEWHLLLLPLFSHLYLPAS